MGCRGGRSRELLPSPPCWRITGYKLNFVAPKEPKSEPYTALQRVEHLVPIQREDQDE